MYRLPRATSPLGVLTLAAAAQLLLLPLTALGQAAPAPAAGQAAPAPAAPTLADRLAKKLIASQPAASGPRIEGRFGPREHDGSPSVELKIGDPSQTIFEPSVQISVDGVTLHRGEYALAKMTGKASYMLRFLHPVPAGAIVRATYEYGVGAGTPSAVLSSGLIGSQGPRSTLALGSGVWATKLPVALYFGQQRVAAGASRGQSDWRTLSNLDYSPVAGGTKEYGFSVTGLQLRGATISYGTVKSTSGGSDSSYRDEFIRKYIAGKGQGTQALSGDPAAAAPEGDSRDVRWHEFRYGDPATSRLWYSTAEFRMDQNYRPVGSGGDTPDTAYGAEGDITAFVKDPARWGGRNLMSAWWQAGSEHAGDWRGLEGVPAQGRTSILQFAGMDISHTAFGIRPLPNLSYSKDTFRQERLDTHLALTEAKENVDFHTTDGGTQLGIATDTLTVSRPSNAPAQGATEAAILADPGQDDVTTHRTTSLVQRLSRGTASPVLSVSRDDWNNLNRLTGIEAPGRDRLTTSLTGVPVLGGKVAYSRTRDEYSSTAFASWMSGNPSTSATDTQHLTLDGLNLVGPTKLNGSVATWRTDGQGLSFADATLAMPAFRIFEGLNMGGAKYEHQRDALGGEWVSRSLAFNGAVLGVGWNAGLNWDYKSASFKNLQGQPTNEYGRDRSLRGRSFGFQRTLTAWGTDVRAGWTQTDVDGLSQGQTYYATAKQPVKLGKVGNLALDGAQYRNVDTLGVLRPSYTWGLEYTGPHGVTAGYRGFEHYGAGDELSVISRTAFVKGQINGATLAYTIRNNPLVNEQPGKLQPYVWRGTTRELSLSRPITPSLSAAFALTQNGLPASDDWTKLLGVGGPLSSALRPTQWASWGENWGSRYHVAYTFGKAKLSLARQHNRFTATGIDLVQWAVDGQWEIDSKQSIGLAYRNWGASSPFYGIGVTDTQAGHPLGEAYMFRYSRNWTATSSLSLVIADLGPLAAFWGQGNSPYFAEANALLGNSVAAGTRGELPNARFFLEYKTLF